MSISDMARRKTVDEVFAPAQQQFRESGMSEEELDRLVDAARHDQPTKAPGERSVDWPSPSSAL